MFYKCSSLTSLDISSFDGTKIRDNEDIFESCNSLNEENIIINIYGENLIKKKSEPEYPHAKCFIHVEMPVPPIMPQPLPIIINQNVGPNPISSIFRNKKSPYIIREY